MIVVVGLGNPGPKYAGTRHNVGAQCVQLMSAEWGIPMKRRNPHVLIGQGSLDDHDLVLAQPRTSMNHSGEAVAYLAARYGAKPQQLLLVYDELDLPLGTIRLRPWGGAGGHRGMLSAFEAMGTQELPRLRVGIGRPPLGMTEIPHVLGTFTPAEEEVMGEVRRRVVEAVRLLLAQGIDSTMGRFNVTAPAGGTSPGEARSGETSPGESPST